MVRHAPINWDSIDARWHAWWRSRRNQVTTGNSRFVIIILAVLLTALVQAASPLRHEDGAYFLIFIPAVMLAAFVGGFRAGALVTSLSLATTLDAIDEPARLDFLIIVNSLAFSIVALGLSAFGDILYRARYQTQRKTQDLQARESHLVSLIDTIPGPMIVLDETGMLQRFNQAAARLFGHSPPDMIGKPVSLLISGPFPGHDGHFAQEGLKYETLGRRKDGSTFPMELVLGEFRSDNRRYVTVLVVDLTDRHITLSKVTAMQNDMVHASRLNLMGTLASAMAHEVNQPLSAIANYLKGLKHAANGDASERLHAFAPILDKTVEQALRAGQIIGRLRDFIARGETDRGVENIGRLIEEAATLALMGQQDRGVSVAFSFDPSADTVLVDRIQIQQVLLNLMRNAIQAMAGTERRSLTLSTLASGDGMLTVRVEDTGKGVADELAGRLFEAFATTRRDGMGLGLSISRMIIEAHGGRIWHEPVSTGGAAFCFTLPCITQDDLRDAA